MDLELINFVNSDLTWNAVKKGRRSMRRRNKIQDTIVQDYEKSGVAVLGQRFADEVIDVPIKKRILMLQSESIRKHSSGEQLNLNKKSVPNLNDFSGIELLAAAAAAACHGSVNEVAEHTISKVDADNDGVKDDFTPVEPDYSSVQDSKSPVTQNVPKTVVRLHWDLNTMMDEWEEPFCDNYNETKNPKVAEDEKGSNKPEIFGVITSKISDTDSCVSKSDVIDSFVHPIKCENITTSTVSVSLEQTAVKTESLTKSDDDNDDDEENKVNSEDRLSDCCGSNVSQDEHVNTTDKIKAGYDSPVEDGEIEETECVDYESDNMYEDNFDTIESVQTQIPLDCNTKIEALGVETVNESQQGDKADTFVVKDSVSDILENKDDSSAKFDTERKIGGNLDRSTSTSIGAHKNIACTRRSRSVNIQDSYSRAEREIGQEKFTGRVGPWGDSFSRNSHGYPRYNNNVNQDIDYKPRGINRAFNTRPPPSDRHESYGGLAHRGTEPTRCITRDRFRRTSEEEYNYPERKIQTFSSSFNRSGNSSQSRRRSRSRSRSGSPIAWHFQKKRNLDTRKQSPNHRPDSRFPTRKPNSSGESETSRSFDNRNVIDTQYRDRRWSPPVRTFPQSQRFDFDPPARLNWVDEKRRVRYDINESYKARYHNKDNGFRYTRNENR